MILHRKQCIPYQPKLLGRLRKLTTAIMAPHTPKTQDPKPSPPPSKPTSSDQDPYPSLSNKDLRMTYRIARGEQGVLTFEPYKSHLLPLWRFKTEAIALDSSAALWSRFLDYDAAGDFVGMDMARKFIQMGMTRAARYANHRGGRKYVITEREGGGRGTEELAKGGEFEGKGEKERASMVFRGVWERCKAHAGYREKKETFLGEQREWDRTLKRREKDEGGGEQADEKKVKKRKRRVNSEDEDGEE